MSYQPKGLYNEFNTFFPWFKIMFYTKKCLFYINIIKYKQFKLS